MPVNRRNGALRLTNHRLFKTAAAWAAILLGGVVTFTVSLEQAKGVTLPHAAEAELRQVLGIPVSDLSKRRWPCLPRE
jgi:hypothetical protein